MQECYCDLIKIRKYILNTRTSGAYCTFVGNKILLKGCKSIIQKSTKQGKHYNAQLTKNKIISTFCTGFYRNLNYW